LLGWGIQGTKKPAQGRLVFSAAASGRHGLGTGDLAEGVDGGHPADGGALVVAIGAGHGFTSADGEQGQDGDQK
jgi:hypothetical protein